MSDELTALRDGLGDLAERFMTKVDFSGECWVWTAADNGVGYGRFRVTDSSGGRSVYAHRLAFSAIHGDIATGMQVDHRCHNRACVRPAHLELVSQQVNGSRRGGAAKHSKTGVRGVHGWTNRDGTKYWCIEIWQHGRRVFRRYLLQSEYTLLDAEELAVRQRLALGLSDERSPDYRRYLELQSELAEQKRHALAA